MACRQTRATSLRVFLSKVRERMLRSAQNPRFPEHQVSLLVRTIEMYTGAARGDDWGHPLGLFHGCYRLFSPEIDEKGLLVAESCSFFILSLDLFDDVQDEDLEGKHYASEGPAIATNSALALLFLAQDALRQAAELEPLETRRMACLRAMHRISLIAIGAQHQDLTSSSAHPTPAQVLEMHAGKTSAVQLVAECAALAAGADLKSAEQIGEFGRQLAMLTQVVDDVRDVFGKERSPDLLTNKATYLRACFDERASTAERAEYERHRKNLDNPGSLEAIRSMCVDSGALDACAQATEAARERIHEILTTISGSLGHKRILLSIVDSLANLLYSPEPLAVSEAIFQGGASFSKAIAEQAQLFRERFRGGFQKDVSFEPWHRPFFLYDPCRDVIHYPDLDGLEEETLPAYSSLFDGNDTRALGYLLDALPLLLAHEMFHAWRSQVDRLGSDAWHEEYVADQLAMGYLRAFDPTAYSRVRAACHEVLRSPLPAESAERLGSILERAQKPSDASADYETSLLETAHLHAKMCLAMPDEPMASLIERWLGSETALAAE